MHSKQPTVEIRLPISANEQFLRMTHYFLESLQAFGGPIGRSAKCVVSVSRDEPYRDLTIECDWAANYNVEFQWLDQNVFDRHTYDATGFHRLEVVSDADVVILADADLLIASNFDEVILEAYYTQKMLGVIAHISPFITNKIFNQASDKWWRKVFNEVELPAPNLDQVHTGWGLMSKKEKHKNCPYYYNYGFVIAPRLYFEKMSKTFVTDLEAVDRLTNDNWAKSQIVNTVSCVRHNIPCGTLSINYNFAMHLSENKMRKLNPDPNGKNSPEDIKIFHYLGNKEFTRADFATSSSLKQALLRKKINASGAVFQQKLQVTHDRIAMQQEKDI